MNQKLIRKKLVQSRIHSLRGAIVRTLGAVYGKMAWVSVDLEREVSEDVPIEPELHYLKELGYIIEREIEKGETRLFQATAKGYSLYCGDLEDKTIAHPTRYEE